MIGAIGP